MSVNVNMVDSESCSDEEMWQNSDGEEELVIMTSCLFCDAKEKSPELFWEHSLLNHKVDIKVLQKNFDLDCFSYFKMINYLRENKHPPDEVNSLNPLVWSDDKYLTPFIKDDGVLQFDIENITANDLNKGDHYSAVAGGGDETDSCLVADLKLELQNTKKEMEQMKKIANEIFICDPNREINVNTLKDDEDEAYFSSYGHFSIHQEMLKDKCRTEYYKNCIELNRHLFKNKIVLDIGCGTGILSMLAAKAGAKLVIGVEMSDIVYQAIDIVQENGLQGKIKLVKGRMEDVHLPVEKVDIIISEWMGYFLLFESMLDTVLWARDHYLERGGLILPDFCSISILGIEDLALHKDNVEYWNDVYGFKMSCMRTLVLQETSVAVVSREKQFTNPYIIKEIDITSCSVKSLEFSNEFCLSASKDVTITALVGYFDVKWKHCDNDKPPLILSTSPFHEPTHWKQTILLLKDPVLLKAGDELFGSIGVKKNPKDLRSLVITINIQGKVMKYLMQ